MQFFLNKFNKSRRGFSLVETLVAISIFTISILTMIVLLGKGISDTNFAKKKIVAGYLAQEGIEYMRNMRDTYMLYTTPSQTGWNNFNTKVAGNVYPLGTTVCATTHGCYFNDSPINYTDNSMPIVETLFPTCPADLCPEGALSYNSTTGKYGFTGTASGFTRKIKITPLNANEVKVVSTVYFNSGSNSHNVALSEYLFNWIE